MKLKNLAFFGVMGAILSVASANAAPYTGDDAYLTTKGYVDARDTATKNAAVTAAVNAISESGTYQTALDQDQMAAVDSGITSTKVGNYDSHIADTDIHVTTSDKATWSGKQDAISDLSDIRSGAAAGATALQAGDVDQTYDATSTDPISGKGVADAGFITNAALSGYATESYADGKAAAAQAAAEATAAADATSKANAAQAAAEATAAADATSKANAAQAAAEATAANGANLTDGTVTKAKLATAVQTSLGLADTALQSAGIAASSANSIVQYGANGLVTSGVAAGTLATVSPSTSTCPNGRTCLVTKNSDGSHQYTPITDSSDLPQG